MTSGRRALVVSWFPYPVDSGDPVRVMEMIGVLDALGPFDFLIVERDETTAAHIAALRQRITQGRLLTFAPAWRGRRGGLWALLRMLIAVLRRTPLWVEGRYSAELRRHLRQHASSYDQLIAIGEAAGTYAAASPGRWHWDKANVISESTKAALTPRAPMAQRLRLWLDFVLSSAYERRLAPQFVSFSVTSGEERERWARMLSGRGLDRPLAVFPSAVPLADQIPLGDQPRVIVWLSAFSYAPNTEGLLRFLDAADAEFRRTNTTLRLIGGGCPEELERMLRQRDFVDFVGFAENLDEALTGATAGVVPVWRGAGIKMKTLTLLSHGLPVVATTCAAEGIPAESFLSVSDDPELLVAACVEAAVDAQLVDQAHRGRRICEERFSSAAFRETSVRLFGSS